MTSSLRICIFASLASNQPFLSAPPFSASGTFLGSTATASKPVCSSGLLASSSGVLPDGSQDYGSHYGSNPARDARLSGHRPPELPEPSMGSRPKPTRILPSPSGLQAGYCKWQSPGISTTGLSITYNIGVLFPLLACLKELFKASRIFTKVVM